MNASKERYGQAELARLFAGATKLSVAKGKKIQTFDLAKEPLNPQQLAQLVLGPTGNLRAPAIRIGDTWTIGFHPELFEQRFG